MHSNTEKMIEALHLARSIMDYCLGDSWERECTASDRQAFDKIYDELFPKPSEPVFALRSDEIKCECGAIVLKGNFNAHVNGKRHQKAMGTYVRKPKDLVIKLKGT